MDILQQEREVHRERTLQEFKEGLQELTQEEDRLQRLIQENPASQEQEAQDVLQQLTQTKDKLRQEVHRLQQEIQEEEEDDME